MVESPAVAVFATYRVRLVEQLGEQSLLPSKPAVTPDGSPVTLNDTGSDVPV